MYRCKCNFYSKCDYACMLTIYTDLTMLTMLTYDDLTLYVSTWSSHAKLVFL